MNKDEKEIIEKVVMGEGGKKVGVAKAIEVANADEPEMKELGTEADTAVVKEPKPEKPKKSNKSGIVALVIGAVVLVAGVVFFLINIFATPKMQDAEYLVEMGRWARRDAEGVVWEFTEVGKGKLTTNAHTNDYNFIWALDGDKIKIETEWLYALEDEYIYTLDQELNTLTLVSGDTKIEFVPVESD